MRPMRAVRGAGQEEEAHAPGQAQQIFLPLLPRGGAAAGAADTEAGVLEEEGEDMSTVLLARPTGRDSDSWAEDQHL